MGRIAVVCGVMAASIFAGSMLSVTGSTSTNTGLMPFHISECAVATNEYGVVMTSPPMRSDCSAVTSAMVALVNRLMWRTPRCSHSAASSIWWNGPPLLSTRVSQIWRRYGMNSSSGGSSGWVT